MSNSDSKNKTPNNDSPKACPKKQARVIVSMLNKNPDLKRELSNLGFNHQQPILSLTHDKGAATAVPELTKIDFDALQEIFEEIENNFIGMDSAKDLLTHIASVAVARQARIEAGTATEEDEKPSNHIVLTGNPGTGKTTITRFIGRIMYAAAYLEKPDVHEVTRKDLVAGYIGQTALRTEYAIEQAEGGVLFIDEAGSLYSQGRDYGVEAVQTLLPYLENERGNFICVMASYPEDMEAVFGLDKGLRSRFPHHCHVDDFTLDQLCEILSDQIHDKSIQLSSDAYDSLFGVIEKCREDADPKKHGNARLIRNIAEMLEGLSEFPRQLKGDFRAIYSHAALNPGSEVITANDIDSIKLEIFKKAGMVEDEGQWAGFMAKRLGRPGDASGR